MRKFDHSKKEIDEGILRIEVTLDCLKQQKPSIRRSKKTMDVLNKALYIISEVTFKN